MRHVFPIISGNSNIPNKENLQFTRLDPIANGTTVDAKPDFYDGVRLEDIDKSVREELGAFIIPVGHRTAPVAPNFFMEAKAPQGAADVAKRQACYDGALGARAMHSLQSYSEGKPVYDGNAYTVTSTYHAGTGTLKLYTTHPTAGPENAPEYHMTQVKGWDLTSDPDTFRQGATAFRNARDWAEGKRDKFITAANERARSTNAEPSHSERMTYPDWLATLGKAQEPPASNLDTELCECNPGEAQEEYAEPFEEPKYSARNKAAGHIYTVPSTFEPSDFNGPVDESESSTFDSYTYNGYLDMRNTYPIQESETSADEIALDLYATPGFGHTFSDHYNDFLLCILEPIDIVVFHRST